MSNQSTFRHVAFQSLVLVLAAFTAGESAAGGITYTLYCKVPGAVQGLPGGSSQGEPRESYFLLVYTKATGWPWGEWIGSDPVNHNKVSLKRERAGGVSFRFKVVFNEDERTSGFADAGFCETPFYFVRQGVVVIQTVPFKR